MSKYFDALVWIDRHEAKIFQVSADAASKFVVKPAPREPNSHRETRPPDGVPESPDKEFFQRITAHIQVTHGTFLAGPGNIKFELKNYLDLKDPAVASRIYRVETIEDTSDAALIAQARRFFGTRGHRDMAEAAPNPALPREHRGHGERGGILARLPRK